MATRDEIRAFALRDWTTTAKLKSVVWRRWRRRHGWLASLRVAEDLRQHVQLVRPGWPDRSEREADLDSHLRVIDALRRVHARRR
ncbi:MAG: hypothetical protein IT370_21040 [Deltaproteobacteria bacterium]|nr:hypothetical protein [Deltaproteobacteria bacterium]